MLQLGYRTNRLPDWLQEIANSGKRILWFGALSFEERCVGTLAQISQNEMSISHSVLIGYPTRVHPEEEDRQRRQDNRAIIEELTGRIGIPAPDVMTVEPYAFQSIQSVIENSLAKFSPDFVIFDITCLTKIHAMALAASISGWDTGLGWCIGYSSPENYGNLTILNPGFGWKDVIVAPLGDTALLYNEGRSRGVLIPGHEADRLVVALSEVEPSGGLIIMGESDRRPDVRLVAERRNQKVIRRLRQSSTDDWTKITVRTNKPSSVIAHVKREIETAKQYGAPVLLFPCGPKPLIFATARELSIRYSEASWFVYPLPSAYDVNYSEGIGQTHWFSFGESTTESAIAPVVSS